MRTISYKLDDLKKVVIPIGYEGENNHTRVIIDAGEVFKQYPAAAATLKVKPPHGTIYPVVVSREGDTVIWDVKETDCASNGTGEAQFTFTENSVIVKSMVTKININRSLVATGPAPDPIEDWLDEANEALEEIQAAEVNQPTIGEDGYWYTWNQETGEYEKTETKAQGAAGAPGQDGQDATPNLITVDYADLTFPVAKDTQCYHDGLLYYAKQDIQTAEAWTAAHWQQTTVEEQVSQLKNAYQGIEASKADGIVKNASTKADTLYDSAESFVKTPKVYGITTQEKNFNYNIVDIERNPSWRNQSSQYMTLNVDVEDEEISVVVTAATNKLNFDTYNKGWKFTAEELTEIAQHSSLTIDYKISTNMNTNCDLRPHFVFRLNGTAKTNASAGLSNGEHTKSLDISSALTNGFDELYIWWELKNLGSDFSVNDYFTLKKFEIKTDTTASKYIVINSGNFDIDVGETTANVPYVLRGVPDDDGEITIDGVSYTADELDASTGKIIRRIDADIDSCTSTKLTDYSAYILDTPTEETASASVCNALKSLKTEYIETEIDANGGAVSFDYLVDTKTYVDKSSGKGFVTPEQYGAIGDGVTDDTEAIQKMFDFGADVVKMSDNKVYMVTDGIVIGNIDNLTIYGNGSTIKRTAGKLSDIQNDQFVLSTDMSETGRTSIVISDLHICANASEFTDDVLSYGYNILPGLMVYGYDNVRLNNVEVDDTLTGMGITIRQAVNGIVDNCYIHDIGQPDNVKILFPNYTCGGVNMLPKDGAYVGSMFSVKNSRLERITASCHGAGTQYAEVIGNTYIECQDVIMEQSETYPEDSVSVNKHRLFQNNHIIRCANALFSASCKMSASSDTTGKTVVIEGNVIEDAGNLNFYDLTSNPRTYSRVARRVLALINDNNNNKAPYQKVVIKNNYVQFAENLESAGACNVFGDVIEFTGNTIISPDQSKGVTTISAVNEDAVIIIRENVFDSAGITNSGFWAVLMLDDNTFLGGGIVRDAHLLSNNAENIVNILKNKMLNDSEILFSIEYSGEKCRIIGNIAKKLITCTNANCYGSGIVKDNVSDTEFNDTTNSGSYTVSGTTAYTMT